FLTSAYNSYSDHSDQKITEDNPATLVNLITSLMIILIAFIEILLSENIRTIKQLIPSLFFYFINVLLTFGCQTFIYYNSFIDKFNADLITQSLYIAVTFNLFMGEITIIIFHPYLNREVKLIIKRIKNKILFCCNNKIEDFNIKNTLVANSAIFTKNSPNNQTNIMLKTLNGKELKSKQSIDGHFDMLKKSWDVK
uniref:7TM_GPCR_Srx domain-containing protein n=1 Tax=Meloidogyne hapla TaxID=6305 RepID=A0A1I8C0M0_MELHA